MIDELFELIGGEEGLIVTLRCDNKFDEEKRRNIWNLKLNKVKKTINRSHYIKKSVHSN